MNRIKENKLVSITLALIMALTLIIIPFNGAYAQAQTNDPLPVSVTVNGQLVLFPDQRPIMVENRVLVPVRGVFEMMGFEITWDEPNRIARLERSDVLIIIPADLSSFVVNTTIVTPTVPQRIVNNRLMLPLRYVAEAASGTAEWDAVNRVAMISTTPVPTPLPPTPTPSPQPEPTPTATPEPTPEPTPEATPPPEEEPTPTPPPEEEPTPTPPPEEPTPTPSPAPESQGLFAFRPFAQSERYNITRTNTYVQDVHRTGILTRAFGANERRDAPSWIDFDLTGANVNRLTGYVGRTGSQPTVPDAATRVATIYGDGVVLQSFAIDGHFAAASFDIDISGVNILRIHFQAIGPAEERGVSLTMFDLYMHW